MRLLLKILAPGLLRRDLALRDHVSSIEELRFVCISSVGVRSAFFFDPLLDHTLLFTWRPFFPGLSLLYLCSIDLRSHRSLVPPSLSYDFGSFSQLTLFLSWG